MNLNPPSLKQKKFSYLILLSVVGVLIVAMAVFWWLAWKQHVSKSVPSTNQKEQNNFSEPSPSLVIPSTVPNVAVPKDQPASSDINLEPSPSLVAPSSAADSSKKNSKDSVDQSADSVTNSEPSPSLVIPQ